MVLDAGLLLELEPETSSPNQRTELKSLPAGAARDAARPLPDATRFPEGGFLLEQ
jgi:hypothetical protein